MNWDGLFGEKEIAEKVMIGKFYIEFDFEGHISQVKFTFFTVSKFTF